MQFEDFGRFFVEFCCDWIFCGFFLQLSSLLRVVDLPVLVAVTAIVRCQFPLLTGSVVVSIFEQPPIAVPVPVEDITVTTSAYAPL